MSPNYVVVASNAFIKSVVSVFLQMTSSTREPKLLVVAGCLRGIAALMINFTKTEGEILCSI